MKYISTLILFISFLFANVMDFGEIATSYPINEKSIVDTFNEGVAELNNTEIKDQVLNSVEKLINPTYKLPESLKEEKFTKEDEAYLEHDILSPLGTVQYSKGMKLDTSLPKGYKENLCFLDAKNMDIVSLIIKKYKSCTYLITNNDIKKVANLINKTYKVGMVYPIQGKFIQRFNIDKLPVKLTLYDNKIDYYYLNMIELKEELKND